MLTMPVHVCAVSRSLWKASISSHSKMSVNRTLPLIWPLSVSASTASFVLVGFLDGVPRPCRRGIIAAVRNADDIRAIAPHNVNLMRTGAVARECDQHTVRRPSRMFVVPCVRSELRNVRAIDRAGVDIHLAAVHRCIDDAVALRRPGSAFVVAAHESHAAHIASVPAHHIDLGGTAAVTAEKDFRRERAPRRTHGRRLHIRYPLALARPGIAEVKRSGAS